MALTEDQLNKIKTGLARTQNDLNKITHDQSVLDQRRDYAMGERSAYQNVLDLLKEN